MDQEIENVGEETMETGEVQPESEPVEEAPSVFDWNGELDSLTKADWYGRLDEPLRNTITRGFEQKYRNFERGFTKSFQETAAKRKDIERRENQLREEERRIQRWHQTRATWVRACCSNQSQICWPFQNTTSSRPLRNSSISSK